MEICTTNFKNRMAMDGRLRSRSRLFDLLCFTFLFFTLGISEIQATHIAGSEISYECIDATTSTYQVTLDFYYDCGATFDPPTNPTIDFTSSSCMSGDLQLAQVEVVDISQNCPTEANECEGGDIPGIQRYTYTGTVSLAGCMDVTLSFELGARDDEITTIVNPDGQNLYVEATIADADDCNSSPVFSNDPVAFACVGTPINFSFGAMDPDGNTLQYTLITPLNAAGSTVTYNAGYSATAPIMTSGGFNLNASTGAVSFTATTADVSIVAILVEEFDNGTLVGSTIRDVSLVILDCDNMAPQFSDAINLSGPNITFDAASCTIDANCPGETIEFSVEVSDADAMQLVTIDDPVLIIPGAVVTPTITNGNPATIDFSITTTAGVSEGTYNFSINAADNACPFIQPVMKNFTLVIGDDVDPVFTNCPFDMTINLDPGACGFIFNYDTPVATDNCDDMVTVTPSLGTPLTGDELPIGTTIFTFTAEDEAGNTTECTFSVNVLENVPQATSLGCNRGVQVSLGTDCEAVIGADLLLAGRDVGCFDDYIVQVMDVNGNPIANNTVTSANIGQELDVMVTDPITGNSCWGTILIEDKLVPPLVCADPVEIDCNDNLAPSLDPMALIGFPLPAVNVNGDPITIIPDPLDPIYNPGYAGPWTLIDFDPCGPAFLNYNDVVAPNSVCDDVDRIITRTYTVTDSYGNSTSCSETIIVNNVLLNLNDPDFRATFCAESGLENYTGNPGDNESLKCDEREDPAAPNNPALGVQGWATLPTGHPFAGHPNPDDEFYPNTSIVKWFGTGRPQVDACDGVAIDFEDTRINSCDFGASESCYKLLRNWTIIDWCNGGVITCQQIIKVEDDTAPEFDALPDLTTSVDIWRCEADFLAPIPAITDLCGADLDGSYTVSTPLGSTQQLPTGQFLIRGLGLGDHVITYNVSDCCGNDGTTSFVLTVVDNVPPVAVCDQRTVTGITTNGSAQNGINGIAKVFASTFDDGSFDNCSNRVFFKVIRMDEFSADYASIACDAENGDDDLDLDGPQSYFDDYVKVCCEDADLGIQVIFRVFDVDPSPFTFGAQFPLLVPPGENPLDYGGVLPSAMSANDWPTPGDGPGPLFGHFSDCMVQLDVDDKIPPFVVAPPNITVTCNYPLTFDETDPNASIADFDELFGEVVENPANLSDLDKVITTDQICESGFGTTLYNDIVGTDVNLCNENEYQIEWGRDGYVLDNCGGTVSQNIGSDLACGRGTITRSWTAVDAAGNPSILASQTITIVDCRDFYVPAVCWRESPKDLDFCTVFDAGGNRVNAYKRVEWPCDITIEGCQTGVSGDPFAPDNLPATVLDQDRRPRYDQSSCSKMAISYDDTRFTLVDNACVKIFRVWTLIDWCLFEDFRACQADPNCDDVIVYEWEWEQVIRLENTSGPTFDCTDRTIDTFGSPSDPCAADVSIDPGLGDDCSELEDIVSSYRVDFDNDGDFDTFGYSNNNQTNPFGSGGRQYDAANPLAVGVYPVGTHRIVWEASDGCGNETTCSFLIIIEDVKPPTPNCIGGLSTIPMPPNAGGFVDVSASMFDNVSSDNCTAAADLIFSFSDDINDRVARFTCDDANQVIDTVVYVFDAAGNFATCEVSLTITDCDNQSMASIAGTIESEEGEAAEDVEIHLEGYMTVDQMTSDNGQYQFSNLPTDQNYIIRPEKDVDYLNGISTYDLVLISRHVLGVQSLDSPYKLIAADINRSGSITTFDLVELRKLILFISSDFPDNTSWRFVPGDFQFPLSGNPFTSTFPEVYDVNGLSDDMIGNFVAIKTGDVNGSARLNNLVNTQDRSGLQPQQIAVQDQPLRAGQTYRMDVRARDFKQLSGLQFTLQFDAQKLSYQGVEAGSLDGLSTDNFGTQWAGRGLLTASWSPAQIAQLSEGISLDDEQILFSLVFEARTATRWSEAIELTDDYTVSEAYDATGNVRPLQLTFGQAMADEFSLLQNQPNPFKDQTVIGFVLPGSSHARLHIHDISGKTVRVIENTFDKGYQEVLISRNDLPATGVLYYTLETAFGTATRKMLLID